MIRAGSWVVWLSVLAAPAFGEPHSGWSATQCRHVALVDRDNGQAIRGVEDIVVDPIDGTAYLSAHDRLAVERGDKTAGGRLVQGGIYALSPLIKPSADGRLRVRDVTAGFKKTNAFHPHGVDLLVDRDGRRRLYVVNRRHAATVEGQRQRPAIQIFDLGGGQLRHRATISDPLICRPNDVAAIDRERFVVTNDHGACDGPGRVLEDVFNRAKAYLVGVTLDPSGGRARVARVAQGLRFANGVAVARQGAGDIFVAATRGDAVLAFKRSEIVGGRSAVAHRSLSIDGGPDNLSWLDDRHLLVGVHSSLLKLALHRKGWYGGKRSPSRLVVLDTVDGGVSTLFDDPNGAMISAATVGAAAAGRLLIGSVLDPGIVICGLSRGGRRDGGDRW